MKQAWNAAVCEGDMGRLSISGNFGGFQNSPITEPIILERNMKRFEYVGQTTIGSGAEVSVETARESLSLTLSEMDNGSFVIFQLPEFTTADNGKEQNSLTALKGASETSYFRDDNALWVKLVAVDFEAPAAPAGPFNPFAAGGPTGPCSGICIDVSR